jgi:hypothetical protein
VPTKLVGGAIGLGLGTLLAFAVVLIAIALLIKTVFF